MFGFIGRFILRIITNGLAILLIDYFVADASFLGGWKDLLFVAVVLALLNTFLRPILKLIFSPLILITFGLFVLVINGFLLWAAARIFPEMLIIPFGWPLLWSTLIAFAVNFVFGFEKKK